MRQVFIIKHNVADDTHYFVEAFLLSYDFELGLLRNIASRLKRKIPLTGKSKLVVTEAIVDEYKYSEADVSRVIGQAMFERDWPYVALRLGVRGPLPRFEDPSVLAHQRGKETWYGPIKRNGDSSGDWYVHPVFIAVPEIVQDGDESNLVHNTARWLVFARVGNHDVRVFWRNFSLEDTHESRAEQSEVGRYPYWKHVPGLIDKLCNELQLVSNQQVNIEELVLGTIWDAYRDNNEYDWQDLRINAEHNGILLNARSGMQKYDLTLEIDAEQKQVRGLRYLAETIRKSAFYRLQMENMLTRDTDGWLEKVVDDEMLRTLIKHFSPKSYEFAISQHASKLTLVRIHAFFGSRAESRTIDGFPHFRLYEVNGSYMKSLQFILDRLDYMRHGKRRGSDTFSA